MTDNTYNAVMVALEASKNALEAVSDMLNNPQSTVGAELTKNNAKRNKTIIGRISRIWPSRYTY